MPISTLNESFNSLIVQLGSDTRRAQETAKTFETAVQTIEEHRQSISGVNMDEELSNLLSFQRAYEASARIITAVDEMMDMLINRTGIVGR